MSPAALIALALMQLPGAAQAGCISGRCQSPNLTFTLPAMNASYRANENITVTGRAYGNVVYNNDGDAFPFSIQRVEIYKNGAVVGNATLVASGFDTNDIPYADFSYTLAGGFSAAGANQIGAKPYDTGSNSGAAAGSIATRVVNIAAASDPNPAVMATLNAVFSLLLDDDVGAPSGGGTGSNGGTSTPPTYTGDPGAGGAAGDDGAPISIAIAPPHIDNEDAGSLPGALSVGSDGAAHYSINIEVPPGTAGLQPALALNYASNRGNGPLGLGWTLSGLSSIQRCGKTIAQDGIIGRVAFNDADRLCMDGQRLVLVGADASDAAYWAFNAEYRTETESFSRIKATVDANGRRSFKVEGKDGRILSYGSASGYEAPVIATINSGSNTYTPVAKSGARAWALDKVLDRKGNYIKIEYEQDSLEGEHRPIAIRYGGVGLPAHAAVQFGYGSRADKWKRYVDETRDDLNKRLDTIRTYAGSNLDGVLGTSNLAREYRLGYDQSPTSGRSILTSVTPCAVTGGSLGCRKSTKFDWGKPDSGKTPGFTSLGAWQGAPVLTTHNIYGGYGRVTNHADYFTFADFDNDGRADVLENRIASPVPADPDSAESKSNEGGNPIPPGTLRTQYRYFHSTGSRFDVYNYQLNTREPFAVLATGDFNGDGAPDLVAWTAGGAKICISPLKDPAKLTSVIEFTCDASYAAQGENKAGMIPYVVDLRGDGRSALYGRVQFGNKAWLCNLNKCDWDYAPPTTVLPSVSAAGSGQRVEVQAYTAFTAMADFGGVGKTYDTRWSETYLYQEVDSGVRLPYQWMNLRPTVTMTHFREPGKPEFPVRAYTYPEYPSSTCKYISCRPYRFEQPAAGGLAGDFNGSGMSGLAFGFLELGVVSGVDVYKKAEFTVCASTGRSLDCGVRQKYSGNNYLAPRAIGNFVGDGQPGILAEIINFQAGTPPMPSGRMKMCRVTGDDPTGGASPNDTNINCVDWGGLTFPNPYSELDKVYQMDLLGIGRPQIVRYYSGKYVGTSWVEDGRWEVFLPTDVARDGEALDRIVAVTNGFDERSSVEYVDGIPSGTVSLTGTSPLAYPLRAQNQPNKVVKRLRIANGVSAERKMSFQYLDGGLDMFGRGGLGYATFITTDEITGAVTTDNASQVWPYVGMNMSSRTVLNNVVLSSTTNVLKDKTFSTAGGVRRFPFVEFSSVVKRDPKNVELGTTETTSDFDNWGNLLSHTVVSKGSSEGEYASTTATVYDVNESLWLLNMARRTTMTSKAPGMRDPNGATQVPRALARTIGRTFEPGTGMLETETIEPDAGGDLKVIATYYRNAFGLVKQVQQTWTAPNGLSKSRSPKTLGYDDNGRFVTSTSYIPQSGQPKTYSESFEYDAATGIRTLHKDINGQTTTWTVNGFAEVTKETRADGNSTLYFSKRCKYGESAGCPSGSRFARVVDRKYGEARVTVPTVGYFDGAGRLLNTLTWGFNGGAIWEDRTYDSRGRLETVKERHFAGATAYPITEYQYDDLDRVTRVSTRDEGYKAQSVTSDYYGLQTIRTDQRGNTRTEYRNTLGRLMTAKDGAAKVTEFEYDPFGNLVRTTDPHKNKVEVEYDLYGRKKKLTDPDLGVIVYGVDALGRTWSQRSPNQSVAQQTIFEFDDLDRMVRRAESDLESRWEYDTATFGNGKLAKAWTVAGKDDYTRTHTYDKFSRLIETLVHTDVDYRALVGYDSWGRPDKETYQRDSSAAKVYDLRYNEYGYRSALQRSGKTLWKAVSQDAALRVTASTLGNGLKEAFDYSPFSGRLTGSVVSLQNGALRLQDGYQYEPNGQAKQRTLSWLQANWTISRGFTEDYTYDKLNRLWTVKFDGGPEQTYVYDDIGNIISKPGVGTYVYPNVGGVATAHAVKELRDSAGNLLDSYLYDANGNLRSGGGRSIDWTSFDMPRRIGMGTAFATFVYGPDHQRVRQDRSDGKRINYGGAQQAEYNCAVTDPTNCTLNKVKTFWPQGVGMEVDEGGQTKLYWAHHDRQGSEVALSDVSGNLSEVLAYDPWGKRRAISGMTTEGDGVIDDHGYTGHEMLDQLGLVHMNGRIYDPALGRFVSADPFIQAPENGQSYNRYSYVWNDPVNMVDPTGYTADEIPTVTITGQTINGNGQTLNPVTMTLAISPQGTQQPKKMNLATEWGSYIGGYVKRVEYSLVNGTAVDWASGAIKSVYNDGMAMVELQFPGITIIYDAVGIPTEIRVTDKEKAGETFAFIAMTIRTGGRNSASLAAPLEGMLGKLLPGLAKSEASVGESLLRFNPCKCFVAGTPVETKDGLKSIEKIQVGDLVAARDVDTGKVDWKPVVRLVRNGEKDVIRLRYINEQGKTEQLGVTQEHPFYVKGRGWVAAGELKPGDFLESRDDSVLTVVSLKKYKVRHNTYNFEVADYHTYFAGKLGALVHNSDPCSYVYGSLNSKGIMQYIGITNDVMRRAAEHLRLKNITIEAFESLGKLTRADARAVEQVLIERFGLKSKGGTLLNKNNSMSPTNKKYEAYIKRGTEILHNVGFPGF